MKRKIRIFVVVLLALIAATAATAMLEPQDNISATRQGVYGVYEKIVNKVDKRCSDYTDALKLIEVYHILTEKDSNAKGEEKEEAAKFVSKFREVMSTRCPLPNSTPPQTVPVQRFGIKVTTKVPTFVYAMYYMPDSLKTKFLASLPEDQRKFAEKWQNEKENKEVNELIKSDLEDELKRHNPAEFEELLRKCEVKETQLRDLKKQFNALEKSIKDLETLKVQQEIVIEDLKKKYLKKENDI
jgi:hypothetical protein